MKLLVRIVPTINLETHRRCGTQFTRDWVEVEADEATANRLRADQMLEVQEGGNHSGEVAEMVEGKPAPEPVPAKASKNKAGK